MSLEEPTIWKGRHRFHITQFETYLNKLQIVDFVELKLMLHNLENSPDEFNSIQFSIEIASTTPGSEIVIDDD